MSYISYNTPEELKSEEKLILEQIEILKSAFKSKVDILVKQKNEAIKVLRESLTFVYELEIIQINNKDWYILSRTVNEDTTLLGDYPKKGWSMPFNIKNDIFYYSQTYYKSACHMQINELLPEQGDTFTIAQLKDLVAELTNYPSL